MTQFSRWWRLMAARRNRGDSHVPGAVIAPPEQIGQIDDGVTGALPVIDSGWMRRHWSPAQRSRYLTESARSSFGFQFDTPNRSAADSPIAPVTEDPLKEWDWTTREFVLAHTHSAYQRNPIANRAVKYTASFVVGEGFSLTPRNPAVGETLRRFIDHPDNQLRKYERQAVVDLLVDGELLLRFYTERGETVMVPLRPWELRYIVTEPGFYRRAESYHVERETGGDHPLNPPRQEREDIPADEMLHVGINQHGYELRGRPELYAVLPWLRAYKEWLENRARQNHWRNALLWWVKIASSAPGVIAAKVAQYQRPPTPGSIAVTSDKEEWKALHNPAGGSDAAEDGRQIKLMSAVGFGLPEYFLADGSNTNLASASKQQLPALTTFADFQRIMVEEVWTPVLRRVLRNAVDAGRLPVQVPKTDVLGVPQLDANGLPVMIDTETAFSVAYEPLQGSDPLTIARALQIAVREGWASRETAARELGLDYAAERQRMAGEKTKTD